MFKTITNTQKFPDKNSRCGEKKKRSGISSMKKIYKSLFISDIVCNFMADFEFN